MCILQNKSQPSTSTSPNHNDGGILSFLTETTQWVNALFYVSFIHVAVHWHIIVLGNGLLLVWHQAST